MRTESLRRVYCDAVDCHERPINVWLPFHDNDIIEALLDRGFKVEVRQRGGLAAGRKRIGRVMCPICCEKLETPPWLL